VFIELTDHLRCPADHAESYLVLIPAQMAGRSVVRGVLGCPVCQAEYSVEAGVARLGEPPNRRTVELPNNPPISPSALQTFLGLEGPGGYVALVGDAAQYAPGLGEHLPGVHLALINPLEQPAPSPRWSVLLSPRLPLRSRAPAGATP